MCPSYADSFLPGECPGHKNKPLLGLVNSDFSNFFRLLNRDFGYSELSSGADLNNVFGRYRASTGEVIGSLLHKPDIVGGEIVIDWHPARNDNSYGSQVLQHIYPGVITSYVRGHRGGIWSSWQQYITNSDLTTFAMKDNRLESAYLDTISNNLSAYTWYRLCISFNVAHPILGGGTFYVEGVKTSGLYEYQVARSYNETGVKECVRSKINGIWNEWIVK